MRRTTLPLQMSMHLTRSADDVLRDVKQFLDGVSTRREFMTFYGQQHAKLGSFILTRCNGDKMLAEDIQSQVFIKAFNKFASYNNEFAFSTWLFTIARNQLTDHWRSHGGKQTATLDETTNVTTTDDDTATELSKAADIERIRASLACIPAQQAAAVEGRYLQHKTIAEVAADLSKSEQATRQLISRGLKALKKQLEAAA